MATHPAARQLADDCAVLELGGETLVLTHDMMVEGIHWLSGQAMEDVAWKLVATNLSDLAAKGAQPVGVLTGVMLGNDDAGFVKGLGDALNHYGVPLLGGDTSGGAGPRALGLTAIGRATHCPVPSRTGARVGNTLYLTGPVGAAMTGFEALRDITGADTLAYRRPVALIAQGQALAPHVTAMMDVSDGLLLDSWRMAKASGVTFAIDSAAVPLAAMVPEARRGDALRWGDDYQLLFAAPAHQALPIAAYAIGTAGPLTHAPLVLDGQPINNPEGLGYLHSATDH